eukprot:scaffold18772_cov112-Isochrysis_galbana.AAC.11
MGDFRYSYSLLVAGGRPSSIFSHLACGLEVRGADPPVTSRRLPRRATPPSIPPHGPRNRHGTASCWPTPHAHCQPRPIYPALAYAAHAPTRPRCRGSRPRRRPPASRRHLPATFLFLRCSHEARDRATKHPNTNFLTPPSHAPSALGPGPRRLAPPTV